MTICPGNHIIGQNFRIESIKCFILKSPIKVWMERLVPTAGDIIFGILQSLTVFNRLFQLETYTPCGWVCEKTKTNNRCLKQYCELKGNCFLHNSPKC